MNGSLVATLSHSYNDYYSYPPIIGGGAEFDSLEVKVKAESSSRAAQISYLYGVL
ncbi:MAG: hypothetical protein ACPLPR_02185 [Bacillota bacterium]